jgi:hypothetical protein
LALSSWMFLSGEDSRNRGVKCGLLQSISVVGNKFQQCESEELLFLVPKCNPSEVHGQWIRGLCAGTRRDPDHTRV